MYKLYGLIGLITIHKMDKEKTLHCNTIEQINLSFSVAVITSLEGNFVKSRVLMLR